jgi:tetratricopeptide (TPR) repeat protein
MSFDPREPLDAIILPDPGVSPRRSGQRTLLVGCVVIGLLFVGLLIGVVAWLSQQFPGAVAALPWEPAEQRRAALVAAFDGQRREIQDADLPEILRLLDEIASTSRNADAEGFRRLQDFDGFLQRIATYPGQRTLSLLDRAVLKFQIPWQSDGVGDVDRFELVQLERPAADQAIAYAYAFNDQIRGDPYRFLLRRTSDGWKVQDWERVATGWSQAEHYARALVVGDDEAGLDRYDRIWKQLEEVETWIESGEHERAKDRLKSIAQIRIPALLAPMTRWRIAQLYSEVEAWDECLSICSQADDAECIPEIYSLQATSLNWLGRYEEALTAIEKAEGAAGFSADVVELKAEVLTALGREDEAISCWRQLAEFLPNDLVLVSDYYDALPPGRRGEVLEVLRLAEDPAAMAMEWTNWWMYRDDETLLTMLQQFVREHSPDSLNAIALDGRVAAYQGRYEVAAECYRTVAERETDVESQRDHWDSFLNAMVKDGRAVEGYRIMPDARRALLDLALGIEADDAQISVDDLPELMDAHRERLPTDPWLHYFAGVLADHRGDLESAEREFGLATGSDVDDLDDDAAALHRDVLIRQGKLLEAYRAYVDNPDVFTELAAKCRGHRDAAGLQQLLDEHRARSPDDPWIAYYAAIVERLLGRKEAALKHLDQMAADDDADLGWSVRRLRAELLLALGQWREAYATSSDPEETFHHLAWQLRNRREWSALNELCEQHRAAFPDESECLTRSVDCAWAQGEYSRVVEMLTPWPDGLFESTLGTDALRGKLVASLLRLGRDEEAFERARYFADTAEDHLPLLVALDQQRQWDDFARALEDAGVAGSFQNAFRWGDSKHFRNLRSDAAAADLRRQFPLPLPEPDFGGLVVLLTAKPQPIDEDRLRKLADDDGPFEIRVLPAVPVEAVLEVRTPAGRIIVAAGPGTYSDEATWKRLLPRHPELAAVLRDHDGWMAVQGVEAGDTQDRLLLETAVRRLAARVIDDIEAAEETGQAADGPGRNLRAVFARDALTSNSRLVIAGPDAAERLRALSRLEEWLEEDGVAVDLERRGTVAPPVLNEAAAQRRRELQAIAESIGGNPQPEVQIGVRIQLGPAAETLWMRVVAVQHEGYGEYRWTGELTEDSQLWPGLKAGERLRFDSAQIDRW